MRNWSPPDATDTINRDLARYRMLASRMASWGMRGPELRNIPQEPMQTLFGGDQPVNGAGILMGSGIPHRSVWMLPQKT